MLKRQVWPLMISILLLIIGAGLEFGQQSRVNHTIDSINKDLLVKQSTLQQFLVIIKQLKTLNYQIDRVEIPMLLNKQKAELSRLKSQVLRLKLKLKAHRLNSAQAVEQDLILELEPIFELLSQQSIDAANKLNIEQSLVAINHQFYYLLNQDYVNKMTFKRINIYRKLSHSVGVILTSSLGQQIRDIDRIMRRLLVDLNNLPDPMPQGSTDVVAMMKLLNGDNGVASKQLHKLKLKGRLHGKENLVSQILENLVVETTQQLAIVTIDIHDEIIGLEKLTQLKSHLLLIILLLLLLVVVLGWYKTLNNQTKTV